MVLVAAGPAAGVLAEHLQLAAVGAKLRWYDVASGHGSIVGGGLGVPV